VSFDQAEKERIRYHLGYLQTQPAASISYGIPRPIQTIFLVESAMDLVISAAEDRVRKLLTTLDEIECRMIDAQNYLGVNQLADIEIRKEHIDQLEGEYCRWAARLADTLGVPLYPGAERFRRLFNMGGNQAGILPVRNN
jgi:hypothetical protein